MLSFSYLFVFVKLVNSIKSAAKVVIFFHICKKKAKIFVYVQKKV
jgi:hypothetical protein